MKRFVLSSASPPDPSSPTLFIDRCAWSRRLGEALRDAGIPFVAHHERFAHDTVDEEWLEAVAREGWLIVTRDRKIRYKPNELAAVKKTCLHMFVLSAAQLVTRAYPLMVRRASEEKPPAFFSVTRSGAVNRLDLDR